jgi:glutamate racemase
MQASRALGGGAAVAEAAPIGVLDSGVGGLSVLRALRAKMPSESFIYVSDSACAPYGDKTTEVVLGRVKRVAACLLERGAKALVLACNTASVIAAQQLRLRCALPIVALEPAIKPACQVTKTNVVLVLATTNTIGSQSVARLCATHAANTRVILQACPGLADLVELGQLDHAATRELLARYLRPGLAAGADVIVLGCTHYAFLAARIAQLAGPAVTLVEPSEAIARQLHRLLAAPIDRMPRPATTEFFTTGSVPSLAAFLQSVGEPHGRIVQLPVGDI